MIFMLSFTCILFQRIWSLVRVENPIISLVPIIKPFFLIFIG
ncbi:hypothetical protein ND2E_4136 [Colwellia psychrerythraea]|uniref:Uncharacterized protein n=1 Tax=Colwellia psychrerythraea TaxID=28229 RepID=A0A099KD98_COLPS|nr:hypothetical protein ND2E_4136 [Colwellia psychrerythraea]